MQTKDVAGESHEPDNVSDSIAGVAASKPKSRLRLAFQGVLSWKLVGLLATMAGLYLFVGLLTFTTPVSVFQSPDENVNYLVTRSFGETGKFYYERDYLDDDEENYLHPRIMRTLNGRVVPGKPLGLPLFYGAAYRIFGNNVAAVALLLAPLCLFFLYRTAVLLLRRDSLLLALAVFGAGPLLYWFSQPFFNILGSTTFFAGGLFFLVRYYQDSRRHDLVLCGVLYSLSMLFRYEYALFASALVVLVLFQKFGRMRWRRMAIDLLTFAAITTVVFVVPVLALNALTYGDPFTRVVGEIHGIDVPGQDSYLQRVLSVFRPLGEFDPLLIVRNLVRFTLRTVPAFTILAVAGLVLAFARRSIRIGQAIPFAMLAAYYLLYSGSRSGTYLATGFDPTFRASMVRYWILLYIAMFFLVGYFLVHVGPWLKSWWPSVPRWLGAKGPAVLVGVMVLSTLPTIWFSWNGAWGQGLNEIRDVLHDGRRWVDEAIVPQTEEDAVIYLRRLDKFVAPTRDVAVWRSPFDAEKVAASIARVHRKHPVYVKKGWSGSDLDMEALRCSLAQRQLFLRDAGADLLKVESGRPPSDIDCSQQLSLTGKRQGVGLALGQPSALTVQVPNTGDAPWAAFRDPREGRQGSFAWASFGSRQARQTGAWRRTVQNFPIRCSLTTRQW